MSLINHVCGVEHLFVTDYNHLFQLISPLNYNVIIGSNLILTLINLHEVQPFYMLDIRIKEVHNGVHGTV